MFDVPCAGREIFFSTHVPVQELGFGFGLGFMLGFGFGLWFGLGVRVKGLGLGLGTFWTGLVKGLGLGTSWTGTSVEKKFRVRHRASKDF